MAKTPKFQIPTLMDFMKKFPDDDACLAHLMETRHGTEIDCPKCGKHSKFNRIRSEKAYGSQWCGHHIHPMVNTPFHRSDTPLHRGVARRGWNPLVHFSF